MNLVRNRRTFLGLAIVAASSALSTACGVKGPLYLPEESDTEEDKTEDEEKTSQRSPAAEHALHG